MHNEENEGQQGSSNDRSNRYSDNKAGSGQGGRSAVQRQPAAPMEVQLENSHNIERAMKVLKRKLIREGLFKELKARRYFEKPSERKKRKHKESVKKQRKEEARAKKNLTLFNV